MLINVILDRVRQEFVEPDIIWENGEMSESDSTFLKEECTRLGIEFEFKAQQPSDAILQFYRETPISLFCNLSYAEGIPVSMMEAAMFGIPLLATDTFGNPEIANNENLRNEMIAKGKIHAQQFTQQKCAEAVMNVYQKLLI